MFVRIELNQALIRLGAGLLLLFAAFAAQSAHAQVVWEDFQGTQGILGTSNGDKLGPSYDNNIGYAVADIAGLRTISATTSNATRTGTSATLNYRAAGGIAGGSVDAYATLCNSTNSTTGTGYDGAGTGSACANDAQGRVMYALIKFPYSGTYNFAVSHDDAVDLDLSTDYSNTSYRTANYDLPVGDAASYTADENTYESLAGVFSTPSSNACILMRMYWNNNGGLNYLRLRWTRPNASGGGTTTEIVPAAYLFDPGLAASSTGCTAVTPPPATTSITLNKIVAVPGRASSADQFTVAIRSTAAVVVAQASTGGTGTGLQASTGGWLATAGTTYQLNDSMVAGSTNTLAAAYNATIVCTRNGIAFTPGGASPTWTVVPASNDVISCAITNTPRTATLQLRKTWANAVVGNTVQLPATTGFVNNSTLFTSVANTANETDTAPSTTTVYVGETGTLTGENFTVGSPSTYTGALACSAGTLASTNGKIANTLTIPVASAGTTITCTWTNTYIAPLGFAKSSAVISDPISASNPKAIPGAVVEYCILITNTATPSTTSLTITDPLPSNVTYVAGSMKSGTSCVGATTVEDDNNIGADESDPHGMSVSGSTVTGILGSMATSTSFAMVFRATVN
jgi:uncharacterized repeat protein (TIGR01451 family)